MPGVHKLFLHVKPLTIQNPVLKVARTYAKFCEKYDGVVEF